MEKKLNKIKNKRFLMGELLGLSIVFLLKRGIKHPAPFGNNIKPVTLDSNRNDAAWYVWRDLFPSATSIQLIGPRIASPINGYIIYGNSVYDGVCTAFIGDCAPIFTVRRCQAPRVCSDINR